MNAVRLHMDEDSRILVDGHRVRAAWVDAKKVSEVLNAKGEGENPATGLGNECLIIMSNGNEYHVNRSVETMMEKINEALGS